jgi:hypothetical protein
MRVLPCFRNHKRHRRFSIGHDPVMITHSVADEGCLAPDHSIRVEGDSAWGHRYWGYALGFIRAMMMAVQDGRPAAARLGG